jgi:hypothetical protein
LLKIGESRLDNSCTSGVAVLVKRHNALPKRF